MRKKQLLNGWWDYRIGKGNFTKKLIPYSDLCVGLSECVLRFNAEQKESRAFLVFEGITYNATVELNGIFLGELSPYIEHRIEITGILNDTDNCLSVKICDTGLPFGPSAGWENYSGIIRDVYIEYTNSSIITDIFWHTALSEDFSNAKCYIDYKTDTQNENTELYVILKDSSGNIVSEGIAATDGNPVFCLDNPNLWSPDTPYLYTLECKLCTNGKCTDTTTQNVGFKDFRVKGKRFYLNGKPFFILGVNKHDLFGDKGHTYSEEELLKDMQMIKATGCNYVRLVHYPHNKKVIEIADKIGLLVSEEPGLWWSDMKNKETCDGALKALEGTIKRDRNHISIAFWLSFNECRFTLEFLKDSAELARKTDPYHMVSGANCMDLEMTKENFLKCGFDFYTMHPYSPTVDRIIESTEFLTEMPLLFTEWGGYYCDRNERLFREFIQTIVKLSKNAEDKPTLAGAVFWEWAETYDFNRGEPACVDGILHEGLVDMYRNPTPNLHIFVEEFAKLKIPQIFAGNSMHIENINLPEGELNSISLESVEYQEKAWEDMLNDAVRPIKDYTLRSVRNIKVGPILPESVFHIGNMPVSLARKPFVLSENELVIPVNDNIQEIFVIGNTSMPVGFPIESEYGEEVAEYIIEYADGTTDIHKMKNGYDITTATLLHGSSRINPIAANSQRIITFSYDKNWEQYLINLGCIKTDICKEIKCIRMCCINKNFFPLLYGISIRK